MFNEWYFPYNIKAGKSVWKVPFDIFCLIFVLEKYSERLQVDWVKVTTYRVVVQIEENVEILTDASFPSPLHFLKKIW